MKMEITINGDDLRCKNHGRCACGELCVTVDEGSFEVCANLYIAEIE